MVSTPTDGTKFLLPKLDKLPVRNHWALLFCMHKIMSGLCFNRLFTNLNFAYNIINTIR
jgi:hypothetical protein